jgi:hypothetical protein
VVAERAVELHEARGVAVHRHWPYADDFLMGVKESYTMVYTASNGRRPILTDPSTFPCFANAEKESSQKLE